MSNESGTGGTGGPTSSGGSGGSGRGRGSHRPPSRSENRMVGRTCYECGEPDHFASVCKEYWEAKDRGVPFVPPPPPVYVRTGRTVFGSGSERRSHSADNYAMRREDEETNAMMRSYFRKKALMWKQEKENLAKEEEKRKQEALRLKAEKKKQEEIAERKRAEDERDARLLRIIRSEIRVESDIENERAPRRIRKLVRRNERGETLEEEKERLRQTIALHQEEEAVEDEELILLRRRAAGLVISDKRKREKEVVIGDSPPMITPTKGQRTGLGTMAKLRIEEIRETGKVATSSSPIPEPVGKIALSLKHISAGTGPGAREKYEADCRELYEALTVEELKEACKTERINYGKREAAIKRLVLRRVVKAYDPINVPLPATPVVRRMTRASKASEAEEDDKESE
ncbi:hypothetical protein CBR_g36333 [Chara braunii]|uniref:CCHC-type domain-containing protein n=1 Tax=Chara braunii TaxID=69332 RepID=A0A388LKQ3_CHABU|nr:hypothetical protein CBR_g36333 [Chara braunii]|eukprot:GBG82802.1 hypothetical protein CBR_g36333 [Chara braunii]